MRRIFRITLFAICSIVFTAIGIVELSAYLSTASHESKLDKEGLVAQGHATTVLLQTTSGPNSNGSWLIVDYEFSVDGNLYHGNQKIRGSMAVSGTGLNSATGTTFTYHPQPGEDVTVTYIKDDPGVNRLEPRAANTGVLALAGMGLLGGLGSVAAFIVGLKRK